MTQVLMLHRVMPDTPTAFGRPSCYRLRGTALTPDELDRLLDAGTFRPLDEILGALRAGEEPPSGQVLTFDDGYREWLEHVAPRLEERRIPATFLPCLSFLRREVEAHPVDTYYWLLDHARSPRVEVPLPDGTVAHGTLETDEGKAELVTGALKLWIVGGAREDVQEILRLLAASLEVELPSELARTLYPSERELRALAEAGHQLGGHGISHRHLTAMDAEEASREISASLEFVTRLSGAREAPFAYPDGFFDLGMERRVERAGATCALTCIPGPVTRGVGLFRMPREFVTPTHPLVAAVPEGRS